MLPEMLPYYYTSYFPSLSYSPWECLGYTQDLKWQGGRRGQQAVLRGNETENSETKGNSFAVYNQNMKTT